MPKTKSLIISKLNHIIVTCYNKWIVRVSGTAQSCCDCVKNIWSLKTWPILPAKLWHIPCLYHPVIIRTICYITCKIKTDKTTLLLQLAIIIGAIVSIVPLIIDPTPEKLLVASGVIAIALGFAFQEYFSSLLAGIVTIYERPYRVGDWIQIGDAYGEVTSIRFRAVEMRTPDDSVVLIPHKKLWDSTIYNDNNGNREHLCVADFYLHPEHDAEQVRSATDVVCLQNLRELLDYFMEGRDISEPISDR